jgi:hypothetical protein
MQDFFRCEPGYDDDAAEVIRKRFKKLVQVQCVINYSATRLFKTIKKTQARKYKLTKAHYMDVKLNSFSDLVDGLL